VADHLVGGLHCGEVEDLAAPFVLGALEPGEAAAVRAHLAGCPEAHPEFAELGSVVPALFETLDPMEPSPGLKGRIMSAAAADRQRAAMPAASVPGSARGSSFLDAFRRPLWAGVAMAAVVAAIALGGWNLALRNELDAYRQGVAAVLDAAGRPGAELAVLTPPDGAAGPSGLAAVGTDGAVTLVMKDLAPTSGAQVYEAWVIAGSSAPVPIGEFKVTGSGTASFTAAHVPIGEGVTVALTLEPGPNATTPTLPIIAVGAARAAT
jgi:anti-sigma-K factor RskA